MQSYPLLKIWASDIAKYCVDDDLAQPEIGWNEKGVQWLICNYKTMTRRELSQKLRKNLSSIDGKLYELRRKGLIAGVPLKERKRYLDGGGYR